MVRFSSHKARSQGPAFGFLPLLDTRLETYPSTSLPNQYFHAMHGDAGRAAAVHEVGFEVRDWVLSCGVI
jgi:hypothetical protein